MIVQITMRHIEKFDLESSDWAYVTEEESDAVEWFMALDAEAMLAQIKYMYQDRCQRNAQRYQAMAGEL